MTERDKEAIFKGGVDLRDIPAWRAKEALIENAESFDPEKHKGLYNITLALLHIVDSLDRVRSDVALLHNKLQPVLKQISDE